MGMEGEVANRGSWNVDREKHNGRDCGKFLCFYDPRSTNRRRSRSIQSNRCLFRDRGLIQIGEFGLEVVAGAHDDAFGFADFLAGANDFDANVVEVRLSLLEGWGTEETSSRFGPGRLVVDEQLGIHRQFDGQFGRCLGWIERQVRG